MNITLDDLSKVISNSHLSVLLIACPHNGAKLSHETHRKHQFPIGVAEGIEVNRVSESWMTR